MTDPVERLSTAEANAKVARERLAGTVSVLQERLAPKRLAREAIEDIADVRTVAVDSAGRHVGALTGVVALAGLFLARNRIAALLGRRPRAQSRALPAFSPDHLLKE